MPIYPSFVGGAYKGFTPNAAADECINLIPELVESGTGKNKAILAGTPGLQVHATLPYYPIRCAWGGDERVFCVAQKTTDATKAALYEVFSDGTYINRSVAGFVGASGVGTAGGLLDDDGKPVTIVPNGTQILITSGGKVYCDSGNGPVQCFFSIDYTDLVIDAATNTKLSAILGGPFDASDVGKSLSITGGTGFTVQTVTISSVDGLGVATVSAALGTLGSTGGTATETLGAVTGTHCVFLDTFFVVSAKTVSGDQPYGPKQINVSASYNGAKWDPSAYAVKEAYPDNIGSIMADHEELWIFGDNSSTEVWRMKDPSDPTIGDFPFQRDPGAIIHQGAIPNSPIAVSIANGVAWIGGDTRGWPTVWLARGYVPMRISTHSIEREWASYSTIADAIAFTIVDEGHSELWISFPAGNATWVWDANTQLWHRRAYGADFARHRAQYHTFEFHKHLVTDYANGKIYWMDHSFYTDDGTAIYFRRTAPHISDELARTTPHWRFRLDHEYAAAVSMTLAWSDNSGANWTSEKAPSGVKISSGTPGRVIASEWRRLGLPRDRVYRITGSGGGRRALVNAYINPTD